MEGAIATGDALIVMGLVCLVICIFLGRFSLGTGVLCCEKLMCHSKGTFRQSLQAMLSG